MHLIKYLIGKYVLNWAVTIRLGSPNNYKLTVYISKFIALWQVLFGNILECRREFVDISVCNVKVWFIYTPLEHIELLIIGYRMSDILQMQSTLFSIFVMTEFPAVFS